MKWRVAKKVYLSARGWRYPWKCLRYKRTTLTAAWRRLNRVLRYALKARMLAKASIYPTVDLKTFSRSVERRLAIQRAKP